MGPTHAIPETPAPRHRRDSEWVMDVHHDLLATSLADAAPLATQEARRWATYHLLAPRPAVGSKGGVRLAPRAADLVRLGPASSLMKPSRPPLQNRLCGHRLARVLNGVRRTRARSRERASGPCGACRFWIVWLHEDQSCGAPPSPQARKLHSPCAVRLRGRGVCGLVSIGACRGRSVLRKGRSKSTAHSKVRPCPYFRRAVTPGAGKPT